MLYNYFSYSNNYLKVVFLSLIAFTSFAQDKNRAIEIIDSLCAPYMHGRGYTHEGDKIAARYIAKHYQKAGLTPFGTTYFQPFTLNVNTFENEVSLQFDNKKLQLGRDFIPAAHSGKGKGTYSIFYLDTLVFSQEENEKAFLHQNISKKAIVYSAAHESKMLKNKALAAKLLSSPLLLKTSEHLTHTIADKQASNGQFIVKNGSFAITAKKVTVKINPELKENYPTQNVIGYLKGTTYPDSFIVFTAHYDHLGDIGNIYFAGANDNAAGIAMMIELAYHYQQNPPHYSVAFMAFGAEEAGLIGSEYYTRYPLFPLKNIAFLLNLDLFATGEEGTTVVNGSVFEKEFALLKQINDKNNYLKEIRLRGKAANSDHYFFSEKGVKAFFLYLAGAWAHYHHIDDKPPVPLTEFVNAFKLLRDFADKLQE